ncbi:MAG: prepilin-type N-terminal cleavage/methylation domain-containing protein [Sedimentisphaerales bacterium]|nr:prepilin-type N-terminal cleavage/methylation domain-containing protein [Sedimentisphaerales bacterium]
MFLWRYKSTSGFSLVEVMIAIVILGIGIFGTMKYQYEATKQTLIAQAHTTSTRVAQLILENWKATGGSPNYRPEILNNSLDSISFSYVRDEVATKKHPKKDEKDERVIRLIFRTTVDELPLLIYLERSTGIPDIIKISAIVQWSPDFYSIPLESDEYLPYVELTTLARGDEAVFRP